MLRFHKINLSPYLFNLESTPYQIWARSPKVRTHKKNKSIVSHIEDYLQLIKGWLQDKLTLRGFKIYKFYMAFIEEYFVGYMPLKRISASSRFY